MNAQVVLIVAGLALIVIAILGSGNFVKIVIPPLPVWGRLSLAVVGCGAFTLAFVPGFVSNSPVSTLPSPAPATSTQPAAPVVGSSPSRAPSGPLVTLTIPTNGKSVSKSQGFVATGSAYLLGSFTVWILDYDGGYTVDSQGTVNGTKWSATDQPLGDSSDHLPFPLTVRVVLANPACAAILQKTSETNNDYLTQLPAGCKVVGGVTVHVTRP